MNRIELTALSLPSVAALAAGSGVNAEQLHQVSVGNPFFVTEVLAAGPDALTREALPRSVSEAVCGRLARLSAKARDIAHTIAVCGPRADVALLEQICPEARSALHECLGAGVLVADGDLIRFRHELARRATRVQIPDFDRIALHRSALTALAVSPVDPNTLTTLAFHADQAGDNDAAIRYGIAAADRAASLRANREAASSYALVLRHADAVSDEQRVVWLERYAFACYLSGQAGPAVAALQDAIALRHNLSHQLEEGDDLRWLSYLLQPLRRAAEANAAAHASLRLLEDLGPSPQLAWSLINMAHVGALAFDPACADYAARAHALGDELQDPAVVLRARGYTALTAVFSAGAGWEDAEGVWREALSTPGLEEHAGVLSVCLGWYAVLHYELDRAEGYLADGSRFCDDHDLGMFRWLLAAASTVTALHPGGWDRAVIAAEQILTRPELSPQHRFLPLLALALIRARRDEKTADPLLIEASGAEPDDMFSVDAARAEVAWLAGDDETALAIALAGLAASRQYADPWQVGHLRRWVHLAGGTPEITGCDAPTPFELKVGRRCPGVGPPRVPVRRGAGPTRRRRFRGEVGAGHVPSARRQGRSPSRSTAAGRIARAPRARGRQTRRLTRTR